MDSLDQLLDTCPASELAQPFLELLVQESGASGGHLQFGEHERQAGSAIASSPQIRFPLMRSGKPLGSLTLWAESTTAIEFASRHIRDQLRRALPVLAAGLGEPQTTKSSDGAEADCGQREVRLVTLLEDAALAASVALHERGLDLVVQLDPDLPTRARVRAEALAAMVEGMLDAAQRVTHRGFVQLTARYLTRGRGPHLELVVEDTGSGPAEIPDGLVALADQLGGELSVRPRHRGGCVRSVDLAIEPLGSSEEEAPRLTGRALLLDPGDEKRPAHTTVLEQLGLAVTATGTPATLGSPEHWTYDLAVLHARTDADLDLLRPVLSRAACPIALVAPTDLELPAEFEPGAATHVPWPCMPSRLYEACRQLTHGQYEPEPRAPLPAKDLPVEPSERPLLLVVDDDRMQQQYARLMLERMGFSVHIANDGDEALECCGKNRYSMVFMDCELPTLDGYEATRTLREMRDRNELPIVALTGGLTADDRQLCIEAGMNDYLSKPLRPATLRRVLGRWLRAA